MHDRFVAGEDAKTFDYSTVDDNEYIIGNSKLILYRELDDDKTINQDAEDKYFDQDEEMGEEVVENTYSGVQDF